MLMVIAAAALLAQPGCGEEGGRLGGPTEVPGAAATAARRAATAIPTPIRTPTAVPVPTPRPQPSPTRGPSDAEQIAAVVEQIRAALDGKNLDALQPLMLDQVVVAPGGEQGADTMDRDLALNWLKDRAGPGPKLISSDVVEHFGLLEVQTGPWEPKAPVKDGQVVFNLHRFNERGDQDPIHGD